MSRIMQLLGRLQGYDPRSCIETAGEGYTYDQLLKAIGPLQAGMEARNLGRGNVIGLRAEFSFGAIAALLAILTRGGIAALIPRDKSFERYIEDAHAAARLDVDADGTHRWQQLGEPAAHPLLERISKTGESGLIIFTSGSTGRPKAALHSVERFLSKYEKPGRTFRTLAFLLFDHVAGLDTLFYTLASGGTLILPERRDARSIAQLIASYEVEVLPTSPSFLRTLCALAEARELNLASLKVITYGSEPMDPSTLANLNARFPNIEIIQKYGTTETGSPRSVSRGKDSLWLRLTADGVQTKVIDNVLWMRGAGTALGYLNAPSPIDNDGWYCTGDLVDTDGDWIRFRGRQSDVINVGGEKVAPVEVEQVILELDFVRAVVVSGEAHPLMGQVVTAKVCLADSVSDSKDAVKQIFAHCRARLILYKNPVRIAISRELVTERQKARRTVTPP